MCNKRSTRRITIRGRTFRVDSCMVNLISALNSHGIETLACCCGHGKYPMTIVYRYQRNDPMKGNIYDFVSGWGIPRKRRFYKKDKKGYYYIPECVEGAKK